MTVFTKQSRSHIVGVAGGSGSGKTYFAKALQQYLGIEFCEIISQDNFYFDQSKNFDFDGGSVNFDHPDSIDFKRLASCLSDLKCGKSTSIPSYDFVTHQRATKDLKIPSKKIIIVDGILIFHSTLARALFDELIYFDTTEELRFERRLERDVSTRGRSPEGVRNQFLKQVKPMHDQFVEPSKAHAQIVVNDLGNFDQVLKDFCQKMKGHL